MLKPKEDNADCRGDASDFEDFSARVFLVVLWWFGPARRVWLRRGRGVGGGFRGISIVNPLVYLFVLADDGKEGRKEGRKVYGMGMV